MGNEEFEEGENMEFEYMENEEFEEGGNMEFE